MVLTRYAVEAKAGHEVDNWIFSISKEASRTGDHHTGKLMMRAFVVTGDWDIEVFWLFVNLALILVAKMTKTFSHHYQGRIDFNTVNLFHSTGMD